MRGAPDWTCRGRFRPAPCLDVLELRVPLMSARAYRATGCEREGTVGQPPRKKKPAGAWAGREFEKGG